MSNPHAQLLADFKNGKKAALARAISIVENHRMGFEQILSALQSLQGRARRVGITGPPGAGKSTLTTRLAELYREQDLTVGIIAVDPTSPFSGGSILGDRIRMEDIALNTGVYIRSLATRGSLGGLASSVQEICDVLDAFGVDRILIETVGVGQTELDIAKTADTTAVILVPESGDSIQTMKAGLLEIGDVFAVNKADRPGADDLARELRMMILRRANATATEIGWEIPVICTSANDGEGMEDFVVAVDSHFDCLESSGQLQLRRRARWRERVIKAVDQRTRERLWNDPSTNQWLNQRLPELETGAVTPFALAEELVAKKWRES